MADFRIETDHNIAASENFLIFRIFKQILHLMAHNHAFGGVAKKDVAAGFIRFGFEGNTDTGDGIHGFSHTFDEPLAHGSEINAEAIFVAVDAGPTNSEIGLHDFIQLQRPFE